MAKIYSFSSKSSHRWQLQLLSIPAHKGALVCMTVPNTEIQHTDIYKQHQKSKKCKDTYQMGLSENSVPKNVMADHHFRCQNTHQIAHPPVSSPNAVSRTQRSQVRLCPCQPRSTFRRLPVGELGSQRWTPLRVPSAALEEKGLVTWRKTVRCFD